MQHDYVLKKLNLTFCPHTLGLGGEVGVQEQIIYFHVVASVIACNLIYSITLF